MFDISDCSPGASFGLVPPASLPCLACALLTEPHRGRVYTVKTERLCQYAPSHYFSLSTQKITQIIINFYPSQYRQFSTHIHT